MVSPIELMALAMRFHLRGPGHAHRHDDAEQARDHDGDDHQERVAVGERQDLRPAFRQEVPHERSNPPERLDNGAANLSMFVTL